MSAQPDSQLLRAYAERGSERAFARLVRRHTNLVHSVAVRLVGDRHLAQDVSQRVFVALAQEAPRLVDHPVLAAWLHRTARNISAQTVRTEVRRRSREEQAAIRDQAGHPDSEPAWVELSPLLDDALDDLSDADQQAVLLRYFEKRPAREMASILGISAEAAQKRAHRAVERLRATLTRRGVTCGATGLAGLLSARAVEPAPPGLAATLAATPPGPSAGPIPGPEATLRPATFSAKALTISALAVVAGAALYVLIDTRSWKKSQHATQTAAAPASKAPPSRTPGGTWRSSDSDRARRAVLAARQHNLADLKDRWLALRPRGNSATKEQRQLAEESSQLLHCSAEAVELIVWLRKEQMGFGALRIEIELGKLLCSPRAAEFRAQLAELPECPPGSGKDGYYRIQDLCNTAGQSCPPERFAAFYNSLQCPAYAQEAMLGRNLTLMRTDPETGVLSTLRILEGDLHSLTKNDHLSRQFGEELPSDVDFAALERLLPVEQDRSGEASNERSAIESARQDLFHTWAKRDPDAATRYLIENPDRLAPALARSVASAHSFDNAEAVRVWVNNFPPGPQRDEAVRGGLFHMGIHAPHEGRALAATILDPAAREKAMRYIESHSYWAHSKGYPRDAH